MPINPTGQIQSKPILFALQEVMQDLVEREMMNVYLGQGPSRNSDIDNDGKTSKAEAVLFQIMQAAKKKADGNRNGVLDGRNEKESYLGELRQQSTLERLLGQKTKAVAELIAEFLPKPTTKSNFKKP
ncbi:MAG: hypothetical protein HYY52_02410 [Candidatus Melainabacteria bacterium]|nr:hypothetical protein [Candidatus Melainabacteria bacterium]